MKNRAGGAGGRPPDRGGVERAIAGFHPDEEGHWVADLACGHTQHVRHDPPLVSRPWVLTPQGRRSRLERTLICRACAEEGAEGGADGS